MPQAKTANDVITRAGVLLGDTAKGRWTDAIFYLWINDGLREIITRRPFAHQTRGTVALVQGHRQTTPSDCLAVIDIPYVVGGNAITRMNRLLLDVEDPDWVTSVTGGAPIHFDVNPEVPGEFIVYPAQEPTPGRSVAIVYGKEHDAITATANPITIDPRYFNALVDYVVYRAQEEDSDNVANAARADRSYKQFMAALGGGA